MRVLGVGGTVELPSPRQRSASRPHPALCRFFGQEGRQPAEEQMNHWLSPSSLRRDSWILARVSWLGAGEQQQVPQLSSLPPQPCLPTAAPGSAEPGVSKLPEETHSTRWGRWATRLPGNPNTFQIRGFRAQAGT